MAATDSARLPGGHDAVLREPMAESAVVPDMPVAPPKAPAPVALPRLSSGFGWRVDPILGRPALHSGIDIPGPLRSPVLAAAGGVVHFAGRAGGYGNMIEVDHGGGLVTRYAHLSRFMVRSGARVERGQEIAMMGSTGRSTGSHLHFEVRLNGQATGPLSWLTGEPLAVRVSPGPIEPHISAFARARAETESVVGAGL
jgi:murein DD-endopeptidase MepM/ murein hydrolase activator NlpD